jgi:acyl-CoA thioesterase
VPAPALTGVTTAFDADTALEPAGDGRWTGRISERWFVGRGPNGGLLAAQAARAMQALAGDPGREPRSLTLHYLEAPAAGPVTLAGRVERAGRSTTAVSLRFEQDGRAVALGLGVLSTWREGAFEHAESAPPAVPAPGEIEPMPRGAAPEAATFVGNYEYRWAVDGEGARVGGWIRVPGGGRPVDAVAVAAFTDAFPPAVFPVLRRPAAAPTLDLTIHFRAPLEAAGTGWVLGAFGSRRAAGGYFEEDGELWSEGGVLLAQSRQLALLREAR